MKTFMLRHAHRLTLVAILLATSCAGYAQLSVAPQTNLQQLAAAITGPGVSISNPQITCHALGYGEFTFSGAQLGVDEGVILTTGRITDAPGPNNNNGGSNWFAQNTPGDALLNNVTGRTTMDACKFEFDIIPVGDSLSFDFVFASEEYNEWVGSQYNDVFGFYISGPGITGDPGAGNERNIARVPGSNQAVTINNVNNGSNAAFYQDNSGGSQVQYDGFTKNLTARSAVTPCGTYHLKLVVADASDRKYDSGVFIDKVESNNVTMASYTANGTPDMVEGCNPGWVRFSRPFPRPTPLTIQYYIKGTAINGTDFTAIAPVSPNSPKSITIPANQTYVDRAVNPLADAINEPTEYLTFILGNPFCPAQNLDTLLFNITDTLIATVSPGNSTVCFGDSVQYQINGGQNYTWSPSTGVSAPTTASPWVHPSSTTNYTITITEGTCSRSVTRLVRVSKLTLSGTVTAPLCNSNTNGAINLNLAQGVAPYTYSWTGPNGFSASTEDISNLAPGTYTVTVTDAACTRSQSFNVIAPATLSTSITPSILPFGQNIACNGGSTGSITTLITGGTAPYSAVWTGPGGFTSSSTNISGLVAGAYTLIVTDANGCTSTANATLTQPQPMTASISGTTPVICFGTNNGSATTAVAGGIPPYTYAWGTTTVQSTSSATGLAAGTYPVTVTDGYGCIASASATVAGPTAALSTSTTAQTNVRCFGNSTGAASISISGGTPPYTTVWNTTPAQNGTSATGLSAGTWTATVTDANGCTDTRSITITQPAAALTASVFALTDVNCFGGNTGSATISASGGTGPYTYLWNSAPTQNTATANNLATGTYACTVRDVNNCQVVVTVTIAQPAAALTSSIGSQTNVNCFGAVTGSATMNVSGGTAPYSYSWNTTPAQNTASANALSAGNWICTISDANGCTTTGNVTITQPTAALSSTIAAQVNVNCFGTSTGSATVSASGGTIPYSFSWNTTPVQSTATASNLAAGTWTCTVTDGKGCSTTQLVTITQPAAPLSGSIGTQTNVNCFGGSSGSATALPTGGTAPYSFSWNTVPAQLNATANNLAVGTWTCTITDAQGCTSPTSVVITSPSSSLTASITAQTNVLIFGQSTGSATVTSAGGTAPYTQVWSTTPAQAGSTANGLAAGAYLVVVTDANGCTASATAAITQPGSALSVGISSQVNVACFGSNTGSATATANGGVAPYAFVWNTSPTQAGNQASGLSAGLWTVTVTDANGAISSASVNITGPTAALTAPLVQTVPVSCFAGTNGQAEVIASGGTAPYAYSWDTTPVQTTASATGLSAGVHTCTVTDANGCTVVQNATITQPNTALSTSINLLSNVACFNGLNGSALASATGGTAPYSYAWNTSPAQNTATASTLQAGNWSCVVTDANGCTTLASIAITQPTAALSVTTGGLVPATCGLSNGSANASANGGTAPYSYSWSTTPVQVSATMTGVNAGTYTVTATDANGCVASANATIVSPSGLGLSVVSTTGQSCFGSANGQATVAANGGIAPYQYSWNTTPLQTGATAMGLTNGTYTATVTDASGCTAQVNVPVTGPTAPLTIAVSSLTDVLCFGDSTGAATVNATGGTAPYSFTWNTSPTVVGNVLSGATAGTYTVSAMDANGCTTTRNVTIAQPSQEIFAYVESFQHVSCFGANDGWLTVQVGGGSGSYTVGWNTTPPQSGNTATGLPPGIHEFYVMDNNGCTTTKYYPYQINGPSAPLGISTIVSDHDGFAISCPGGSDGSIDATVTGGTAPYTSTWTSSTGITYTTQDISGAGAGAYTLSITDANGCSASSTVNLTAPTAVTVNAAITTAACQGGNTGAIDATISGGVSPYTVSWSGPGGYTSVQQDLNAIPAGIYTITVTDAHGCTGTSFFDVSEPGLITIAGSTSIYTGGVNVSCHGAADGSIDATVVGGVGPYTYSWSGPSGTSFGTEDITGLTAGNYALSVLDANGCTALAQFPLTQPTPLVALLTTTLHNGAELSCATATDGAIDAFVNGGTPALSFTWTGPNSFSSNSEDLTGLGAGSYDLQVTDQNGCTVSASTTLNAPNPLSGTATSPSYNSGSNISCAGGTNGSIDLAITGGTGMVTTAWSGPNGYTSTDQNPNGLSAGTYTATTTDVNGCTATTSITLTEPAPVALAAIASSFPNGTSVSCANANDGTIDLTVTGGAGNVSYQWTGPNAFTATSEDLSGLIAGDHVVTTLDDNGCTATLTITLTAPAPLISTGSTTEAACAGGSSGAIDLTVLGGTAPYSFLWSGPGAYTSSNEDINGLFAGVYVANVTDANGCVQASPYTVSEAGTLQSSATLSVYSGGFGVSCAGSSDGSIDVIATGGNAPYYYQWLGPAGFSAITPSIQGLQAGTYYLVLNDQNGCSTLFTYTLTSADPLATGLVSQVFPGGANTGCTDSQDGTIDALVIGGIQPYQYAWTNTAGFTASTEDLTGLEPGTYALTVTDAVGCTKADSITLEAPVPVDAIATAVALSNGTNISCDGTNDGSIDLAISGGAQPYYVEWTGPQGYSSYQQDPTGLQAGTYDALITDLNGCTAMASVTLSAPPPISIALSASLYGNGFNVPCEGSTAGTLSASVSGGSASFSYAWSGPNGFTSNAIDLTGIGAGTYILEVTDGAGCVATESFTLTQPSDLNMTGALSDAGFGYAVSCGAADGSITINTNGGTAPYVFDWTGDNGFASLDQNLSGLAAGTYVLNLVDANGCSSTQSFTLAMPNALQTSTLVTGTICDNAIDGAIDLTVNGGVAPLSFAWTGANGFTASTEDISMLAGGTYDVVITDAMNCSTSTSADVLASSDIELTAYVSDHGTVNIPCVGDSSGVIELTMVGGAGTLDLQWLGPNGFQSNNAQLNGLVAGTYQATITDVNGCTADTTITLTEPTSPINATLSAFIYPSGTHISCTGASDGAIDATVTGGTGPYLFDWRGPDSTSFSTEDINGLVSGTYDLVIVDANQCTFSTSIQLNGPDSALAISATLSSFTGGFATSCASSSDGTIDLSVNGGNGGYGYAWSGPNGFTSASDDLTGLGEGTYTVTITDLNGCALTQAIDVTAPLPVSAILVPALFPGGTTISCSTATDGSVAPTITGGVAGYTTQWTGPNGYGSSAASINQLGAGTYCLTVADTNGCTAQACIDLIAPLAIALNAIITDASCGASNGAADLTVSGGTGPFAFAWSSGAGTEDLSGVPAATYTVQVTDANGCTADTTVAVNGSATLQASGQAVNNACADAADGSIDLTLLSGATPYNFTWSNGATSEDLTGLVADTYAVVVTDASGCTWNGSFDITAPLPINAESQVLEYANGFNVSAMGSADGQITVSPSGGTAPYSYAWSNGAITATANALAAGTYTVLITDANGCSIALSFILVQPTDLAMPTGFSPNGDGANDSYIIQGLDGYASNQFVVFNRWGNVVYDRLNYRNDWTGDNSQGEQLPDGTYFVILTLNEGAKTLQTYVDLRR